MKLWSGNYKTLFNIMKKPLIISFFFFALFNNSFSQINKAIEISKKVFKQGTVKAGLFYKDFPPEIKALQEKAISNLNKYPEWRDRGIIFMIKDGDQYVEFMNEMGLTKEEFDKMYSGFLKGKQRYITDTVYLKIVLNNNIITFSTKGKLSDINPLQINLSQKTIQYDCWVSTKEFFVENGAVNRAGLEGSEVHLERKKNIKKLKANLIGFTIFENTNGEKCEINLMLTDDNYKSGDKPRDIWFVIF